MFKKIKFNIVLLFVVSFFTIIQCIHEDDLIRAPISAEVIYKPVNLILQRVKRQVFGLGAGRPYPLAAAQSRAPTVIVVPERGATGTGAIPTYGNVPISPYSVGSPNRGTTVVVSQVPEYGYNGVARTYDIIANPIRI